VHHRVSSKALNRHHLRSEQESPLSCFTRRRTSTTNTNTDMGRISILADGRHDSRRAGSRLSKNAQLVISTATSLPPSPTLNTPMPAPHLRATTPGGPIVFPRAHEQHRRPGCAVVERSFLPRSAPPHPPRAPAHKSIPLFRVQKRTRLTERNERCDPTGLKMMRMLLHTHTGSLRGTVNPAVGVKEKSIHVRLAFIRPHTLTHFHVTPYFLQHFHTNHEEGGG
jgi:hypothetical protein